MSIQAAPIGHVIKLASIKKTVLFIFLSPAVGLVLAYLLLIALTWMVWRAPPRRVHRYFRRLQLVSAAAVSLGHGGNDAQKTMGIVSALLVGTHYLHGGSSGELPVPLWIVLFAHSAIALGTLSGGWRIVRTLGSRLTKLKPIAARVAWAWIFTIPVAGLMGAAAYRVTTAPATVLAGLTVVALLAAVAAAMFGRVRRPSVAGAPC